MTALPRGLCSPLLALASLLAGSGLVRARPPGDTGRTSDLRCLQLSQAVLLPASRRGLRVRGTSRCRGVLQVRLWVRRPGEPVGWLLGDVAESSRGSWVLRTRTPHAGVDASTDFEVRAVASARPLLHPDGWFAVSELVRAGFIVSPPRSVEIPPAEVVRETYRRKVRFTRLNGHVLEAERREYDVALSAHLRGQVHLRPGDWVACAVQPDVSEGIWLMPSVHHSSGEFSCTAYLGDAQNSFHEFQRFRVFAVVTRRRLAPAYGEYGAELWHELRARGVIVAQSEELHVRRTMRQVPGQLGATVAVVKIGGEAPRAETAVPVSVLTAIQGETSPALGGQGIALYACGDGAFARWRRIGFGLSTDGRNWLMLPRHVGAPGQRRMLIAVRYMNRPPDLNDDKDAKWIVAMSEVVWVMLEAAPGAHDEGEGTEPGAGR